MNELSDAALMKLSNDLGILSPGDNRTMMLRAVLSTRFDDA